jgi:hypothetical protein
MDPRALVRSLVLSFAGVSPVSGQNLEEVATCAGTEIGQSVVDLHHEDESAFEEGVRMALLAYYGAINAGDYSESSIEATDRTLGEQTDRVIAAVNEDRYDGAMFGKVLDCYRLFALGLYDHRDILAADGEAFAEAVAVSTEALRDTFGREE